MAITTDLRVNTNVDMYLDKDPRRAPAPHFREFVRTRARGKRLLDFGCGNGAYAYELQALGYDVTAVDVNPKYVEMARSAGVNAVLLTGDALPFPDKAFDTVYLLEVLEHLPDDVIRRVLPEVRRLARHNALFSVPDNTQYDDLVKFEFLFGHYRAVDHIQFFTESSLRALLASYFPGVAIERGDPLFPHLLLPPVVRRPLSLLYRLGLLKPTLYSRLFAEARVDA